MEQKKLLIEVKELLKESRNFTVPCYIWFHEEKSVKVRTHIFFHLFEKFDDSEELLWC